ncbi:hypothetical protein N7450_009562 [Penicillium hetheringtonii]|uniref:Plus3 domain-containing protein n=1 Tax=Penicillium hetheringtonii TaxID=911720 RepID=A0AAD6DB62_9EURO|nr:hypothetical protein N7450_009562 [Penicillium hetheringtonii]
MADALDEELLALAGDSDEEQSPPPQQKDESPAPSRSPHSPDRDLSPETTNRKGQVKGSRRSRKAVRDEEDGEMSDAESHHSLQSAPMSESDSEGGDFDAEDRPIFPYDKLYYSAKEKDEIMAMPEIQREEMLSERAQQVDRHNQDLALRRLLASREREEARADKQAKRKAGSAGLDETQRKSSRQKTTLGGRKVGETSAAIDAYKRQREQKGKRDLNRGRDTTQSRRRSSVSSASQASDDDADAESDVELDDRVGSSGVVPKDDPPAELREIQRARVGRSNFAQVCFYPGFEDRITGCYARVNIGPSKETGLNEYRLCLITGFTTGKPYAMEASNGRPFVVDQYAKLAHGKAIREFPFIACSDSPFTEAEYARYRKTMAVEDCKMATQSKLAAKVTDINKLINHQFTKEELSEKLRKQGALDEKKNVLRENDIQRDLQFARANGNDEEVERLQKELDDIRNPNLSWGTSLVTKPAADQQLSEAERVHQINLRNQKLNHENVRRAQLEERKAARKAAAAVARGEAAVDPFMRVRTVAKTHHDVNTKPGDAPKPADSTPTDTLKDSPKPAANISDAAKASLTPKKKNGFMISYRNNDDENIAALDMDIDIEI